MVRLRGEDECSAVRDVSKHLHRRNGRESDIMGLVGIVNVLISLFTTSTTKKGPAQVPVPFVYTHQYTDNLFFKDVLVILQKINNLMN